MPRDPDQEFDLDVVCSAGRWRWVARSLHSGSGGTVMEFGPVTFSTPLEAVAELERHLAAPLDWSGRRVRSLDELKILVTAAAESCPDSDQHYVGNVFGFTRDADGHNWNVSYRASDGSVGTRRCFRQAMSRLVAMYSLIET